MKTFKTFAVLLVICLLLPQLSCGAQEQPEHLIQLSSAQQDGAYVHSALTDGIPAPEFTDYVWCADPYQEHSEIPDAPAEYHIGQKPETDAPVYISHDILYYPQLPADGFQRIQYDDEMEWCFYYPETSAYHEYIFSSLPIEGNTVPERMMHTPEEAFQNAVLHIVQPGVYRLQGEWHGQIWVELGKQDAVFADETAKVTLILDNVDVTCTVAPALVFYSAYECDNAWEQRQSHSASVDTDDAGAAIVIADGSKNHVSGANIYRMLKAAYKQEDSQNPRNAVKVQKKMRKIDGTVYSFVSMKIDGEKAGTGVLNIHADFEGLDTELHLTVNGGHINIRLVAKPPLGL